MNNLPLWAETGSSALIVCGGLLVAVSAPMTAMLLARAALYRRGRDALLADATEVRTTESSKTP
jgi:multisubunit Na+/H+ antiporter MnhG subunit